MGSKLNTLLICVPTAPRGDIQVDLALWLMAVEVQSNGRRLLKGLKGLDESLKWRVNCDEAADFAGCDWPENRARFLWASLDKDLVARMHEPMFPKNWLPVVQQMGGRPIPANRNDIVRHFLKTPVPTKEQYALGRMYDLVDTNFDALLFIDSDVIPEHNHLFRICEALDEKEVDAVSGIYCMDTPAEGPVPIVYKILDRYRCMYDGEAVVNAEEDLFKLDQGAVPAGFLAVKRYVFEEMIRQSRVWFKDRFRDGSLEAYEIEGLLRDYGEDPAVLVEKLKEHHGNVMKDDWGTYETIGSWATGEDVWFPVSPDTAVLGADWRWRPIHDYGLGDEVLAFDEESPANSSRRLRRAVVEGVVHRTMPRLRIVTDEREIITTAEHPWLAKRGVKWHQKLGWRWLPAGDLEPGMLVASVVTPEGNPDIASAQYAAGYAQGLMHSDGARDDRRGAPQFVVRMKDVEPLERLASCLSLIGVPSVRGAARWDGDPRHAPLHRVGVYRKDAGRRLDSVVSMSEIPSAEFASGYLAGMFDGDGSYGGGILRIYNQSDALKDRVGAAAALLGMQFSRREEGMALFGQDRAFSFFQRTLPALRRRTEPRGQGQGNQEVYHRPVVIRAIETLPPGEVMCLGTSSGTFIADGLASHNCRQMQACGFSLWVDRKIHLQHFKRTELKRLFVRQEGTFQRGFAEGQVASESGYKEFSDYERWMREKAHQIKDATLEREASRRRDRMKAVKDEATEVSQ